MHEHDLDLIAEYAEGSLTDGGSVRRAADLVVSCDLCAAEFEQQQSVRAMLASVAIEPLSELERARLRRDVLDAIPTLAVPIVSDRLSWWQRRGLQVASVAAVALVAVGLFGVLGQMGSSDTAAHIDSALSGAVGGAAESGDLDATTTAAAMPESDGSEAQLRSASVIDLGVVDRTQLLEAIENERKQMGLYSNQGFDSSGVTTDDEGATSSAMAGEETYLCGLSNGAWTVVVADLDGRPVAVAIGAGTDGADVAVWTDTCEPADLG